MECAAGLGVGIKTIKWFSILAAAGSLGALGCSGDAVAACGAVSCEPAGAGGFGGSAQGAGGGGAGGAGGTTSAGGAGGGGTICGGQAQLPCAADEFCDYQPSICGGDDSTGLCKPRPTECPDAAVPTCGCDGNVHPNPCEAQAAGFDASYGGGCTPPSDGVFACGPFFCDLATEYCLKGTSDVGGEDDTFECGQLPTDCGNSATCACLAGQPCGDNCSGDAASGLMLTCLGG